MLKSICDRHLLLMFILFIWGFYDAFNSVQVISRWIVLWAEETSYIELVKVLNRNLPTIGKPPTCPHKVWGLNRPPLRWEVSELALNHDPC